MSQDTWSKRGPQQLPAVRQRRCARLRFLWQQSSDKVKKRGAAVIVLVLVAILPWKSGTVRSLIVDHPWIREALSRIAGRTIESHLENLGALGFMTADGWTPFTPEENEREVWKQEHISLLHRVRYEPVAEGVRVGRLTLKHEHGNVFSAVFVEANPEHASLRVLVNDDSADGTSFVHEMAAARNALAAINGGFFDSDGALGLVLSRGNLVQRPNAGAGYLLVQSGKPLILNEKHASLAGADEGIQCGPVLLVDGRLSDDLRRSGRTAAVARRSAAALTHDGNILLLSTDVELGGLTLKQLAMVLGGLGARHALALDGGASAQLYVRDIGVAARGWDKVPVGVGLFAKPAPAPTGPAEALSAATRN